LRPRGTISSTHLLEEEMEQYAMGTQHPASVPQFEVQLVIWERCQDRMAEMDVTVATLREACKQYELRASV
jgi:anti-sigma factor ChrR (cupin superfamily)